MVHVNDGNKGGYLWEGSGTLWTPNDSLSVRAQIAKSGEKAPNCVWTESKFGKDVSYLEHNSKGQVVRDIYDSDGDDTIDCTWTYAHDDNGNLTRIEKHRDADGIADSVYMYEYDEKNRVTKAFEDPNTHNNVSYVETYEYNEADKKIKYTKVEYIDAKPSAIHKEGEFDWEQSNGVYGIKNQEPDLNGYIETLDPYVAKFWMEF